MAPQDDFWRFFYSVAQGAPIEYLILIPLKPFQEYGAYTNRMETVAVFSLQTKTMVASLNIRIS